MIPAIEKKSGSEIRKFQEAQLQKVLGYLQAHSPFYQRHFQDHRVDTAKIMNLGDLATIPPTTKNDLQEFNWDFLCVPRAKIAEYASTSGTMGKPVTIALTGKDIQRLAYNELLSLSCADGVSGDLYQLMLTLDRQFMAGIAYYEGIRKLGAGIVRVGPGVMASQLETILSIKPTVLIAVPSFLVKLIEHAGEKGISLEQTSVKKIVCIGENIRRENFQLNALGTKITENWNVHLYSTYASTEMQTAFTECSEGVGGHQHPELIITEVLDDNNRTVMPGQIGELTVTTLGVEGMPLLRYKTGDVVRLHEDGCSCGRTTARVSPVLGRRQQMIKLKGTTLYPPGVFEILHLANVGDYVVEVFTNELGNDDIKLYVAGDESVQQRVKISFQSFLRVMPGVVLKTPQEIERMQMSDGTRKPRKFIDRRIH
ncbi:MAG TPA: AMP-binding protein [Cyclobacteriaceae bacterium]|nr:AMP-binding protein [Cyclobacteriaceae bacterium]